MCMHAVDGEAVVAIDSASVEPAASTVDVGVGAHLQRPSTAQHLSTAVSCSTVIFIEQVN